MFSANGLQSAVTERLPRMPVFIAVAGAFLVAHALAIQLSGKNAMAVSYVFLITAPLLATFSCHWRAWLCHGITRAKWALVGTGMMFWSAGMVLVAHHDIFLHTQQNSALLEDFLFFTYGVPVLVALSVTTHDQHFRPILLLDVLQAVLAVTLVYFVLFKDFPFAKNAAHPIDVQVLVQIYDIENIALALVSAFSLLASPQAEEKTFHRVLCIYAIGYAVIIGFYNHATAYWNLSTGRLTDLSVDIPFLLLAVPAFRIPVRHTDIISKSASNPVALFVNNSSPILFTLAVLALGVFLMTENLYLGIAVTCVALIVYCLRATMLQNLYFSTQLALYEANNKLHELSLRDSLTGVANRGGFERALKLECERAERTGEALALLMIDIDCFKSLNDTYGHVYGDDCLSRVATELERNLNRSSDTIARYGGEEFAVLLPKTDIEGAVRVAEKLRSAVTGLFISNETDMGNFVSISVGVATYDCSGTSNSGNLVEAADKALYVAKRNGRNRYEIAEDSLQNQG